MNLHLYIKTNWLHGSTVTFTDVAPHDVSIMQLPCSMSTAAADAAYPSQRSDIWNFWTK